MGPISNLQRKENVVNDPSVNELWAITTGLWIYLYGSWSLTARSQKGRSRLKIWPLVLTQKHRPSRKNTFYGKTLKFILNWRRKKFYKIDASLPTFFARGSCQGRRRPIRPTQPMRPTTPTTTTPSSSKPSDRCVSFLTVASTSRNAGSENLNSRCRKYFFYFCC